MSETKVNKQAKLGFLIFEIYYLLFFMWLSILFLGAGVYTINAIFIKLEVYEAILIFFSLPFFFLMFILYALKFWIQRIVSKTYNKKLQMAELDPFFKDKYSDKLFMVENIFFQLGISTEKIDRVKGNSKRNFFIKICFNQWSSFLLFVMLAFSVLWLRDNLVKRQTIFRNGIKTIKLFNVLNEHEGYYTGNLIWGKKDGPWEKKNRKFDIIEKTNYKNGEKEGLQTGYYSYKGGRKSYVEMYENGVLHGRQVKWGHNGTIIYSDGYFENGKKNGKWIENAAEFGKEEGHYKNGVKIGEWKHWGSYGLTDIKNYDDTGSLHGKVQSWHNNRRRDLQFVHNYKNGILHGKYTMYQKLPNVKTHEGNYVNGKKEGTWYSWKDGKLVSKTEYKNDAAVVTGDYTQGT